MAALRDVLIHQYEGIELDRVLDSSGTGLASDQTKLSAAAFPPLEQLEREIAGKQITLMHLERLASQSRVVYTHERPNTTARQLFILMFLKCQEKGIHDGPGDHVGTGSLPRSLTNYQLGEEIFVFSPFRL